MGTFTKLLRRTVLTVCCFLALGSIQKANALIYTAQQSGNYNDPNTWLLGLVPPSNLIADVVNIPSGITVTLTGDQTLNGALSVLNINGVLNSQNDEALILQLGSVNGNGLINVDSLVLSLSLGVGFTGDIDVNSLTSLGTTLTGLVDITVHDILRLEDGLLNLTGGILNLDGNPLIVISGGSMAVNGGLINILNGYSVLYVDASATSGWELTNGSLLDVEVNLPLGETLTLGNDVNLPGNLNLISGILDLNGHDLILGGDSVSGDGLIHADVDAGIVLNLTGNRCGILHFDTANGGGILGNLTLNLLNGNSLIELGTGLHIDGVLNLQNGLLDINSNDLILDLGAVVNGGSENSYVVTDGLGHLMANVAANVGVTLPIGTNDYYAPGIINLLGGSGGLVGLNIHPNVYVNGLNGAMLNTDQPLVNGTWHLLNPLDLDLKLNLMWEAGMEANGFNRDNSFISQILNGVWTKGNVSAAVSVGNMYGQIIDINAGTDVTLSVFDDRTVTTDVPTLALQGLSIYPNPATSNVNIETINSNFTNLAVYDMAGRVVDVHTLSDGHNSINVSHLSPGQYYLRLQGKAGEVTHKIARQ